jgi:hypothetical protein
MASYHLSNIRAFLTEGFSEAELRDFCFDTPEFRPVRHELAHSPAKPPLCVIFWILPNAGRF